MIIDFHTYIGESILGQSSTEKELMKNMERNNIDRSIVCPVKTTDPFFRNKISMCHNFKTNTKEKSTDLLELTPI